jgi:hypothetical protein
MQLLQAEIWRKIFESVFYFKSSIILVKIHDLKTPRGRSAHKWNDNFKEKVKKVDWNNNTLNRD